MDLSCTEMQNLNKCTSSLSIAVNITRVLRSIFYIITLTQDVSLNNLKNIHHSDILWTLSRLLLKKKYIWLLSLQTS